jgi:hypothetical protein
MSTLYTQRMMSTSQRPRRTSRLPVEHASIEYLFLADHAESLNGKLYVMGGGWDQLTTPDLSGPVRLSIACGVQVPWNETDDDHTLSLVVEDSDGNPVAPALQVGIKTGRSPTMVRGSSAHVTFAVQAALPFPGPGTFVAVATVDDRVDSGRRLPFHIRLTGAQIR